jgi:general stress protein 26
LVAKNIEGSSKTFTFIFLSPNLAKSSYAQLPLQLHHKNDKRKKKSHWSELCSFFFTGKLSPKREFFLKSHF